MDFVKKWIIDSYNNKYLSYNSCLFITGNSGIGKSYSISKLYKAFVSSLIQSLTNNTQKKIIIIDEFETLLSFDSTMNIHLLHFLNTTHKHIPIICICSNDIIKKLGEIKKKCLFYELPPLNDNEIHNILISYNPKIVFKESIEIIKKSNYNIKKCIQIISNTYYNNNDDIYDITELYSINFNRNNFKQIILKEQWIIPLKFHENLIIELNNRISIKSIKYNFYKKFIYNFCYFDIMMMKNNEIAIDQLFTLKYKQNKTHNLDNFTKILSYLSLQKKNNKIIYKLNIPNNHFNGNYHISIINRKFIY